MARDPREDDKSREVTASIHGLNELPSDMINVKICRFIDNPGYLDNSDISALNLVSKTTQGLFQPDRLQMLADKLLLQVMRGEQAKAEVILKISPDLLTIKGRATDYSGRTFHCTAFQYALWALDTRYMCPMMLDCLPYSPKGECIHQELLIQLLALESSGIEYQLDNRTVREKHYDFTPLLAALKTYVDTYDNWSANSMRAQMQRQWCEGVGLAQRNIPAHVAQHYCDPDEGFDPIPSFNKPKFTRVLQFYNHLTTAKSHWFSTDLSSTPALGVDFGIFRAEYSQRGYAARGHELPRGAAGCMLDWKATTALCQVRTKDLELLKERLQRPLQKPKAGFSCVIC